jgi:HlyD family secretion protein
MVSPGQPLAMLGNPDLTLQVSSREADISARLSDTNNQLMNLQTSQQASEQAVADVTYALHKAEEELSKRQMLREHGVYNDAAVQTYIDEVAYQKQRLAALKSQQAQQAQFYTSQRQQILASANDLRQSREEVRKGLNALNLTAPMQGRLTDFDLKPGQAVKMGDPLGEVDSEGTYKLKAEVDEFYLSRLSVGLKATANVHGKDMGVHISKVFPQVNNGRITVELEFDAMPADLKRGETVDVRLSLGATEMALLAPSGAWLNDTGGASIFVLNGGGDKASRRAITVGRRNPEYVEILSGLKPGEHVVTGGTQNLTKAQHLRLTKSAK